MDKETFDYKPLACNKNDRQFKTDVKKSGIPLEAVYIKLGDVNTQIVRYVVMWGDVDIDDIKMEGHDIKTLASLLEPIH
jgi:hypothetical protein